jgi:CubicO group peptidase (beta-lactamase class C family)
MKRRALIAALAALPALTLPGRQGLAKDSAQGAATPLPHPPEYWRDKVSAEAWQVLFRDGTEPAGSSRLDKLYEEGELDGVRLLQAETVRLMASDQLPKQVEGPNWAPGNRFGLNVAVVNDSSAAQYLPEGTYWWWGIQGPWMWVDPANGIITLGMMQNTDYRHSRVVHGTVSNILYRPAEQ